MTAQEFEQALDNATPDQNAQLNKFFSDCNTKEQRVDWYVRNRHRPGMEDKLAYILKLPTEKEKRSRPSITQHVGSAQLVVGHNAGTITVNVQQFLQQLEQQIAEDPSLQPDEKKGLLQRLKDFALHPYVSNLVTNLLYDGGKVAFELAKQG